MGLISLTITNLGFISSSRPSDNYYFLLNCFSKPISCCLFQFLSILLSTCFQSHFLQNIIPLPLNCHEYIFFYKIFLCVKSQGVCCPDGIHCCPRQSFCDMVHGRCFRKPSTNGIIGEVFDLALASQANFIVHNLEKVDTKFYVALPPFLRKHCSPVMIPCDNAKYKPFSLMWPKKISLLHLFNLSVTFSFKTISDLWLFCTHKKMCTLHLICHFVSVK